MTIGAMLSELHTNLPLDPLRCINDNMTAHSPIPIYTPIYTIGYGERTPAQFLALLQEYEIAYLIDVRMTATQVGGLPDLAHQGIRYVDMRAALGHATAQERDASAYQQAIGRLRTAYTQQQRVALLGDPAHPARCYRSYGIGATLTALETPVVHIDEQGALQTQAAIMAQRKSPTLETRLSSASALPTGETPQALLKRVFGYDEFRPGQAQIVENVLARRDTLVIMPTGGGKSLCYQLPALLLDGLTLVVSPLIALMQDQVDALRQLGVPAAYLNSTLAASEYNATVEQAKAGQLKLLYMAPETLRRPESLALLDQSRLQVIAIDEAHCISQWGHDFRPEYRQLVMVRQRFPQAVCIALTATATPRVQQDIKEMLELRAENAFVASFDRPNLLIEIKPKVDTLRQVLDFLAAHPKQSGIIYCATQRHVDDLAATLNANGIGALPYHAGLEIATRQRNQRAFMVDDVPVMVATIAFGMGVDKPDVRFVLHVDLPQDVENYYQQIGRAGRDGERAACLLLFGYGDVHTIQHFIREGAESERAGRMQRLQTLVGWAETTACRRRQLLAYFGENYAIDNCGMCDNCVRPATAAVDLTIDAQKFLSCVLRTGEKFGTGHIIQVLRGSRAQNVLKWEHDKLSTHGIGQAYAEATWKHLAQQFIQQGLVQHALDFGTLSLTDKGRSVLNGAAVWGTLPEAPTYGAASATPPTYELVLFEQLRAARKTVADDAGVPPYMIFADRALQEMATYLPQSVEGFALIHGVGRAKIERYGEQFLALISDYCAAQNLTERPKQARPVARVSTAKARSDEVGEGFTAGQSLAQIAQQFGVKRQTVIANLAKYADEGNAVDVTRLQTESTLTPQQQAAAIAAFGEFGDQYLKPVFDALAQQVDYEELHLVRLLYRLQQTIS